MTWLLIITMHFAQADYTLHYNNTQFEGETCKEVGRRMVRVVLHHFSYTTFQSNHRNMRKVEYSCE